MSASIAHEVNQPLASIVANGEAGLRWLNRKEPVLPEVESAMKRIVRDATRASEVVQRLRALARKAPVEKQPLDLNDVIRESIGLLQREILANRVALTADLGTGLAPVLADRIELQQVVINLMVNGMQALASVTDRPRLLVVRSSVEGSGVLVAIQDSGVGLDASTVARLFSPFFTTREAGMGLGLSICRSIVEAHGGRIWASANDGPGATFAFSLPFQQELAA
jgi:C4-dicarboxylate-specific signal transduction histidine kinase